MCWMDKRKLSNWQYVFFLFLNQRSHNVQFNRCLPSIQTTNRHHISKTPWFLLWAYENQKPSVSASSVSKQRSERFLKRCRWAVENNPAVLLIATSVSLFHRQEIVKPAVSLTLRTFRRLTWSNFSLSNFSLIHFSLSETTTATESAVSHLPSGECAYRLCLSYLRLKGKRQSLLESLWSIGSMHI